MVRPGGNAEGPGGNQGRRCRDDPRNRPQEVTAVVLLKRCQAAGRPKAPRCFVIIAKKHQMWYKMSCLKSKSSTGLLQFRVNEATVPSGTRCGRRTAS